jgi:hypothetical protein
MMCLIARHRLIYNSNLQYLDFSVEEPWICPPMPTRAYSIGEKFLTQPKPDLAICFYRPTLIPDNMWDIIPTAIARLICYDSDVKTAQERAFYFFTIEAKKGETTTGDSIGKCQSLNNASQALHNMFEFFRDAGPQHEDIFFDKVRFFSAVTSSDGITIRIHRATRGAEDRAGRRLIMPDRPEYPLVFEHQVFCRIEKSNFDREAVISTIEKILIGYGVNELR